MRIKFEGHSECVERATGAEQWHQHSVGISGVSFQADMLRRVRYIAH